MAETAKHGEHRGYRIRLWYLILLITGGAFAQQSAEIRVNVNLVNVALTVRDTKGALAGALSKDDFEVFEDGVPQTVQFFSRSADVPLTLGLLVDGSGSQEHFFHQHHKDLQTFLKEVLRPGDRAFLVGFSNSLRWASDYSASAAALIEGLRAYEHRRSELPTLGPPEIRELGTAFYDAIYYAVTEKLAHAPSGRKALVLLSDGEDNSSAHHMLDAIEACQRADASVFAIRYTEGRRGRLTARNKYGISVIRRLAAETGGADFDAEADDLGVSFRRIGEDLRLSYELAYSPQNNAPDGSFRKIAIRIKRPGYTVCSKTGYFADAGSQ